MNNPYISICIPAYKRISFLERLLYSISEQTFQNYEVIITDDSPDEAVENYIAGFTLIKDLKYFKNKVPLGTPENWNEAIRKASGNWIKLMHDDDWFCNKNALQKFYEAIKASPECSFFFCAYQNVTSTGVEKQVRISTLDKWLLKQSPFYLFKTQSIGNPSCTLFNKDNHLVYDSRLKWVVDFDYYIRYLLTHKTFAFIDDVLINVGIGSEQVTAYTFRNPTVEIPENHLLLRKFGSKILSNIFVYDYFWRMYRNLKIRDLKDIDQYSQLEKPVAIKKMVNFQKRIPQKLLFAGVFSKFFMTISYLITSKK